MIRLSCMCDIGSVLIGDERWTFAVPNIGGDGETDIRIYDSDREFANDSWTKGLEFISSVQGRFGIYDYDCAFNDLLSGKLSVNDAMAILDGRYGVYRGFYKVAFVKWRD